MADAISSLESKLLLFFFSEFALLLPLDRFFFLSARKEVVALAVVLMG